MGERSEPTAEWEERTGLSDRLTDSCQNSSICLLESSGFHAFQTFCSFTLICGSIYSSNVGLKSKHPVFEDGNLSLTVLYLVG